MTTCTSGRAAEVRPHRIRPVANDERRGRGLSAAALSRTRSISARPATWCSTFGSADFIRVPLPAARMTTWRSISTRGDPNSVSESRFGKGPAPFSTPGARFRALSGFLRALQGLEHGFGSEAETRSGRPDRLPPARGSRICYSPKFSGNLHICSPDWPIVIIRRWGRMTTNSPRNSVKRPTASERGADKRALHRSSSAHER